MNRAARDGTVYPIGKITLAFAHWEGFTELLPAEKLLFSAGLLAQEGTDACAARGIGKKAIEQLHSFSAVRATA